MAVQKATTKDRRMDSINCSFSKKLEYHRSEYAFGGKIGKASFAKEVHTTTIRGAKR
jgi:hypothetical protein